MINLLEFREKVRNFYGRNSFIISLIMKLLVAAASFLWINKTIGYCEWLDNWLIVLVCAVFCAFLPSIATVLTGAVMILLHLNSLSIEVMLSVIIIFIIVLLIYLIFLPGKLLVIALVPLAFYFKVPYIIPLLLGIMGSFSAMIPMSAGIFIFYILEYIKSSSLMLSETGNLTSMQRYIQVINGIKDSQSMRFFMIAFLAALLITALLSVWSGNHSKQIALIAGTVVELCILLIADLYSTELMAEYSIISIVLGTLFAGFFAQIYQFFVLALDYKRTEYVQFEDDEYYYYIKAVPKIAVTVSDRKVTKITGIWNNRTERYHHSEEEPVTPSPDKDKKVLEEDAVEADNASDF